ncbi:MULTISPECIES: MobF family relaxase [unclassified Microbacterium]|uniref:MobF family relaxase n=3 Tax=Microbacterium TaxID=33882 RepID=UPI003016CDD8
MRGGLERWKRGVNSQGLKQAIAYAMEGTCDSHLRASSGVDALEHYADAASVSRFVVEDGAIAVDELDEARLAAWVDGRDPDTGERRGRELASPVADLVLDGTINAPKSYSLAAILHPELAAEFEQLQDRLRDRVITSWQRELNARRGAAGRIRENLSRVEVVELQHKRSRALDPHVHRHLWLNVKVRGEDGRWSNIDSRVAMKMHTLVNAEGELAARTDPQWVAALARHGYTLGADGEISELAQVVKPMSRRSNQIEANRAMRIAEWKDAHPGQEPDHLVLTQIDRWAWAQGRPNKPGDVDEADWEQMVRRELTDLDPAILLPRGPVDAPRVDVGMLDRDLLASAAAVDADNRSAGNGGRFSMFDLRAGATRAVAASGVVADRALLGEVIDDVVARARLLAVDLVDGDSDIPQHIKSMMSIATASLKVDLAARFDALTATGVQLPQGDVAALASEVLEEGRTLDEGQTAAAGAIAGTDRLVTVTGPAGTGKTTMLRVAREALERQGRRMVVVAATKKAASVAGREVGTTASSLHGLLHDHGFRWSTDATGRDVWVRLQPGQVDPSRRGADGAPAIYAGPRTILQAGDRVVVDEAGMVDLQAANALAQLALETGVGIAMVGDHLQAMPVGHSGAMAMMKRRSTTVVELTAVHRFVDQEYAQLSLRLREPASRDEAIATAKELDARGHVAVVEHGQAARERMVDAYFEWAGKGQDVALVTSTNEEAQQINEAIQARRVQLGQVSDRLVTVGQNEQRILVGDVVQTRRNDAGAGVENRALWKVADIADDGVRLVATGDSGDVRDVTAEYMARHVHLAYASTVHGVQGETTAAAVVGPGVNAAGLYVGMTRGRIHNEAIVLGRGRDAAVDELAATMMRGAQEVTLDDATAAAAVELGRAARRPVPSDGPVARWDDRRRRPLGAIVDLDRYVAAAAARVVPLRDRLDQLTDLTARGERTLAGVEGRLAAIDARNHAAAASGRALTDRATAEGSRDKVRERLTQLEQERAELLEQYRRDTRIVDAAPAEASARTTQPPAVRGQEDQARLARTRGAAAQQSLQRGPSLGR